MSEKKISRLRYLIPLVAFLVISFIIVRDTVVFLQALEDIEKTAVVSIFFDCNGLGVQFLDRHDAEKLLKGVSYSFFRKASKMSDEELKNFMNDKFNKLFIDYFGRRPWDDYYRSSQQVIIPYRFDPNRVIEDREYCAQVLVDIINLGSNISDKVFHERNENLLKI